MTFRIAIVQPISHRPGEDERNVADAVRAIEHAAHEGADFVCFPETYPGPWRMPATFDPTAAHGARRRRPTACTWCSAPSSRSIARRRPPTTSSSWPIPTAARRRATGAPIRTGRGSIPAARTGNSNTSPGNDFPVFDTAHGKVGLAMCSEVYMPEVTRALALRGAELIFMPAGTDKNRLWATWRTLIWARAIENLAIVVTTQNLFDHGAARARHGGGARGDRVREHGRRHEPGRCQPRSGAPAARRRATRSARRQAAPPSRACSARNGSGRSFTTRSIRGRCAKRLSDRPIARIVPARPELGPRPHLGYTASAHRSRRRTAATMTRRWRNS